MTEKNMDNETNRPTWRDKAEKEIEAMSMAAYREANFCKRTGKRYKEHRQYAIPILAQELVDCLEKNDEERAKAIFIYTAIIPESRRD